MTSIFKPVWLALLSLASVLALSGTANAQAGSAPSGTANAQPPTAPSGTYRQSCKDITFVNNVLSARCDTSHMPPGLEAGFGSRAKDGYQPTALYRVETCRPGADIWNTLGNLYCYGKRGPYQDGKFSDHVIPFGDYVNSCNAPKVKGYNKLTALCLSGGGDQIPTGIDLRSCDTTKSIDNVQGQLSCAKLATAVAPSTFVATPAQAKLSIVGCDLFLGRANEFLCRNDTGFAQCKALIPSGQVKACHAPDKLTTDCQPFLGRANEYLCVSETAYQQCMSFQAEGKLKACHAKGH